MTADGSSEGGPGRSDVGAGDRARDAAPHDHDASEFGPFEILCLSLAAQAHVALGLHPDPATGKTEKDLAAARQAIDLLGMLETKTRGNLEPGESALLGGLLTDLRLAYVREAR